MGRSTGSTERAPREHEPLGLPGGGPGEALQPQGELEVLYAKYFDDRSVFGWAPTHAFSGVSSMGDVFFGINFWYYSEEEGQYISEHLCWLDPKPGT